MSNSELYLVTGGTGLVGNNVIRQLLADGKAVRVMVRPKTSPESLDGLEIESVTGDICDGNSVRSAMTGCTHVIHAAGFTHIGWRRHQTAHKVNVEGTTNIATAALENQAKLVHVSTVDTLPASKNGEPVNESAPDKTKLECTYVVTKREAESAVLRMVDRGLNATIVNPGFMLGPYDWKPSSGKMLLAVAGGMLVAPVGGMSGCDVRDVAAAIITAARIGPSGERFILAGENLRYLDAWKMMSEVTGGRVPLFPLGPLMRFCIGKTTDLYTVFSGREGDVNSAMLEMSKMLHYYDSAKAERTLGYQRRPFRESIEAAWDWFQSTGRTALT